MKRQHWFLSFPVAASLVLGLASACAGSSTTPGSGGSCGLSGTGGSGGSGTGGQSGTGGSGVCNPACESHRNCCGGQCVNVQNDPHNCGDCGIQCTGNTYCSGTCVTPPCTTSCSGGTVCCGEQCCTEGQICCDPQGPIDTSPVCTTPSDTGTCPMGCSPLCICASPDTPIATPEGNRPIASLRVGDLVYSVDRNAVTAVPLLRTNRTAVSGHHVVRVALANGSVLEISAGHPTADGRTFEDLRAGGKLDSTPITSAEVVAYSYPFTYDILPASDSGTYFAGGALIGSTLKASAASY
jgi:hypothetical protein